MTDTRMKTTYSLWALFKNCRKKCQIRYLLEYVSPDKNDNFTYGTLIHNCLEHWYKTNERNFDAELTEAELKIDQEIKSIAMMDEYLNVYPTEDFKVIEVEYEFEDDIINPETGHKSRSFKLGGKVDGIVQKPDGTYWILEHKTASTIDAGYISKLWTDFQILLYAYSVERTLDIKIEGIIYNILGKCGLKMGKGESEAEYQERYDALVAKSKSGKSSAKRKMSETEDMFFDRCTEWYQDKSNQVFHREEILLDRNRIKELQIELWDLTKSFLEAQKRGVFYKNNTFCTQFNSLCEYYQYCSSGENPMILENFFIKKEAHEELTTEKEKVF